MISERDLISRAERAREKAYAPYSDFPVGAALEASDGEVFTGCNVENASYGLTVCAERAALFAAVAAGRREFTRLALSMRPGVEARAVVPCGACRQVLAEFAPDLVLLLPRGEGRGWESLPLASLLPRVFRFPPRTGG
jgi:cytidine deaminase